MKQNHARESDLFSSLLMNKITHALKASPNWEKIAPFLPDSWKDLFYKNFLDAKEKIEEARAILKGHTNLSPYFDETYIKAALPKITERTASISKALGLSADHLFEIYSIGYEFLQQHNYNDANLIFFLLTTIAPSHPMFWLALAKTEEAQEHYEAAAYAYIAGICEKHLDAAINAAYCLQQAGQIQQARELLEYVVTHIEETPQTMLSLEKIKQYQQTLL